jgi:ribosomal protein L29
MIKALPPDPQRLATKDDLAVLGSELRAEMADLRTELRTGIAELRTEMRDMTSGQTRTMMLGLVGSLTALAATQMIIASL